MTEVKKMEPHSPEWERKANALARSWVTIVACHHCGHPVVHGYCCGNETCPDPSNP